MTNEYPRCNGHLSPPLSSHIPADADADADAVAVVVVVVVVVVSGGAVVVAVVVFVDAHNIIAVINRSKRLPPAAIRQKMGCCCFHH